MNASPSHTSGTPAESAAAQGETSSPLFDSLAARLDPERKVDILDLGAACSSNVDYFSRFSCRLHIADALDPLSDWNPPADPDTGVVDEAAIDVRVSQLLPRRDGTAFDLILCWDLLNYLDRAVFRVLMAQLARHTGPGTHLHAFVWSQPQMPMGPARFRLGEGGRMRYAASAATRECPRYTQRDLERLMPQFAVGRSVLLRSGLQEYLFDARIHAREPADRADALS
ncbi:MAG: hypothetical protein B7Z66_04550 [Chromatiales bacterium 21-64-14]|nr:MAG: hypothetical protein B7Z66_04550 [Chromatiales bacterium 21-64-14]HQU14599.1 methyltransferase domain-containing protein [Gammaproteobacteria bacterium]